jgi:hypothetical protein
MTTQLMRKAAILAASAVVAGMAFAAGTPSASANAAAVKCTGWAHSAKDGRTGAVRSGSAPAAVHDGPYGKCDPIGSIGDGVPINYDCYVTNDYGHTWTWVRGHGWVFDDYLVGNGANEPC